MAVDHRAAALRRYGVEQVAEQRHVARRVLVTRDDLVDGVDYHGLEAAILVAPNQRRGQLVERHRPSAQVEHQHVTAVRAATHRVVDVPEPVLAADAVKLQVHVEHLAARDTVSEPRLALGDADSQLHEKETLASLGGRGKEHLVALSQKATD